MGTGDGRRRRGRVRECGWGRVRECGWVRVRDVLQPAETLVRTFHLHMQFMNGS